MLVLWCTRAGVSPLSTLTPCLLGGSFPKKVVLLSLGLATHFLILARILIVSPAKRVIFLFPHSECLTDMMATMLY